jgi:hypothetical protein
VCVCFLVRERVGLVASQGPTQQARRRSNNAHTHARAHACAHTPSHRQLHTQTHTDIHRRGSVDGQQVLVMVASVVEQEVAGELQKR